MRRNSQVVSFTSEISPSDVNTVLNRLGFRGSLENLLTGDRIVISTADSRKLLCFPASTWPNVLQVQESLAAYVNVNLYGGLRFFRTFEDAVNNNRAGELPLEAFAGNPLPITVEIEDTNFEQQYSAGLISGSGSIDALFNLEVEASQETSLLLLQLIQRVEIGSGFKAELFLTNELVYGSDLDVFYSFDAVITRAGVEVGADRIINVSMDFLSTGEIQLKVGRAESELRLQDGGRILLKEFDVDSLLLEVND
ncbi:MAG: hypothetical protein EB101_02605 [Chitinophagia bacterium]|nr:hypothetical protein [Chitinophagia bacterium]